LTLRSDSDADIVSNLEIQMTVAFPAPNANITHTEVFNLNIIKCIVTSINPSTSPSDVIYTLSWVYDGPVVDFEEYT